MQCKGFPDCCGIYIISGFGWDGEENHPNSSEVDITNYLNYQEDFLRKKLKIATIIVALNGKQEQKIGKIFRDRGYVPGPVGYNRSGWTIHPYTLVLNPPQEHT